jgi:hypothetical protein
VLDYYYRIPILHGKPLFITEHGDCSRLIEVSNLYIVSIYGSPHRPRALIPHNAPRPLDLQYYKIKAGSSLLNTTPPFWSVQRIYLALDSSTPRQSKVALIHKKLYIQFLKKLTILVTSLPQNWTSIFRSCWYTVYAHLSIPSQSPAILWQASSQYGRQQWIRTTRNKYFEYLMSANCISCPNAGCPAQTETI